MSNATSIKQLVQQMSQSDISVIQGVVLSTSPLSIRALNDDKLILSDISLIVPEHLTNYQVYIDIAQSNVVGTTKEDGEHEHDGGEHGGHESGDGGHTHDGGEHTHQLDTFKLTQGLMTVYNALQIGDKVHLLAHNEGKKYYILDRVVS